MMIFLLKEKNSDEVGKVFNWIQEQIGIEKFKEMFPLILTDRGTEFINPFLINNLKASFNLSKEVLEDVLTKCDLPLTIRGEALDTATFVKLANKICEILK